MSIFVLKDLNHSSNYLTSDGTRSLARSGRHFPKCGTKKKVGLYKDIKVVEVEDGLFPSLSGPHVTLAIFGWRWRSTPHTRQPQPNNCRFQKHLPNSQNSAAIWRGNLGSMCGMEMRDTEKVATQANRACSLSWQLCSGRAHHHTSDEIWTSHDNNKISIRRATSVWPDLIGLSSCVDLNGFILLNFIELILFNNKEAICRNCFNFTSMYIVLYLGYWRKFIALSHCIV